MKSTGKVVANTVHKYGSQIRFKKLADSLSKVIKNIFPPFKLHQAKETGGEIINEATNRREVPSQSHQVHPWSNSKISYGVS